MLEEYIKNKAHEKLNEKLANIAHSFSELVPGCEVKRSSSYNDHADAHGSNILTDCFGRDFPEYVRHSNAYDAAKEYVQLLMLAFELCGYRMSDHLVDLKASQIKTISQQIMEQMESAVQENELETSVTIKGKGIKIEGK
jgi:hypothetical protein